MKVICETVKQSHLNRFAGFITEEVFLLAKRKDAVTLGASIEDDGKVIPVGIIQYLRSDLAKESAEIIWLYVDEEYRRKGIGSKLIETVTEDISKSHINKLDIRLYEYKLYDCSIRDIASFFERKGFKNRESKEEIYFFDGKNVFQEQDLMRTGESLSKAVISFSKLTPDMLAQVADGLSSKAHDASKELLLRADKSLSFLYEKGTSHSGALITEKSGETYYVRSFFADNSDIAKELEEAFLLGLDRKMQYSDKLVIKQESDTRTFLEKILPAKYLQQEILMTYSH